MPRIKNVLDNICVYEIWIVGGPCIEGMSLFANSHLIGGEGVSGIDSEEMCLSECRVAFCLAVDWK